MIALGTKVRERVSGFEGVVVARTTWLTGCDRYTVQPSGLDKAGKPFETCTFDEPQLIVLGQPRTPAVEPKAVAANPGGPRPEPARRR